MNRIILSIFAAGFCFAIGSTLECYECQIGFWNLCYTTKTTCGAGELCYSGVGKAAEVVDVKMKGCLKTAMCNKTDDVNMPFTTSSNNTIYSMTKTCCDTDLCNAAPGLPRTTVLPLALASLTTVFMAKVLV